MELTNKLKQKLLFLGNNDTLTMTSSSELANPNTVLRLISIIKDSQKPQDRKLKLIHLDQLGNYDKIIHHLSMSVLEMNDQQLDFFWRNSNTSIRYGIIANEGLENVSKAYLRISEVLCEFNTDFQPGILLRRSFSFLTRRRRVFKTPFTVRAAINDYETVQQLLVLLENVSTQEAIELLEDYPETQLALLCKEEIKTQLGILPRGSYKDSLGASSRREVNEFIYSIESNLYDDENDQNYHDLSPLGKVYRAYEIGCMIPDELPFLAWLQENAVHIFETVMHRVLFDDYDDVREEFYELQKRNRIQDDIEKSRKEVDKTIGKNIYSKDNTEIPFEEKFKDLY